MVLKGIGWDRIEFPESNLHMCGRNDTKIVVHSMKIYIKKGDQGRNPKTFSIRL